MMKVIRANTRVQFTAQDIDFILSVLRPKVGSVDCLIGLLTDEESRDLILDDPALLKAVLEDTRCLHISTHFYFYILVRQVFRRSGVHGRGVADYVASVLSEFSQAERSRAVIQGAPTEYFVDMLAALRTADDSTTFQIRAHIGNYSLYLSGVFPERIRSRCESKGFPDLNYYEALGRTNYRVARDHRLARRYDLTGIFDTLSEQFQVMRRALNDLSERLVSIGDTDHSGLLNGPRLNS